MRGTSQELHTAASAACAAATGATASPAPSTSASNTRRANAINVKNHLQWCAARDLAVHTKTVRAPLKRR